MTDASEIPPCFLFHHQYNAHNSSCDTSRFRIHCTLEKGAEAYHSGVRVVVIAKKIGFIRDRFTKPKIHQVIWVGEKRVEIEPPKDTNEVIDDHALSVDGPPLYTLILELVDLSNATWSGTELRFQAAAGTSSPGPFQQIPDTHKVLCEYEKRTTVHSPSFVLILAAQLRRYPKYAHPMRIGLPTHGFRILPPSERRPLFNQPPPEILHHIFSDLAQDRSYSENWRKVLVALSLVCHAWWKAALCIIYEDFESSSQVNTYIRIERLATTLEDNPMWGRYIKQFSPCCFTANTGAQFQRDVLAIFKTTSNMRELSMGDVDSVLAGEFVKALCKMNGLRTFTQSSEDYPELDDEDYDSEERAYLNAAQLTKCFAHWPKLREATVHKFGQPFAEDGNEFAPAQCALDQITFETGFVSIAHLRAITASSQDTLHIVALSFIRGISNKELTSWLCDFGPNLTSLKLFCNIFARSRAEDLAVDTTIQKMTKLYCLEIDGTEATALTFLKFKPEQELEGRIHILGLVPFDMHAFVKALYTTHWKTVDVGGFMRPGEDQEELIEEAERVAEKRGIYLSMG